MEARIDQVEAERLNNATTAGSPIVGDPQAGNSQTPERPVTPLSSHRSREMSTAISSVVEDRKGTLSPDRAEHNPHGSPFRKPSFLRDDKPSTSALRGLFQKHGGSATSGLGIAKSSTRSLHRTGSFLSQDEYPETVDGDTLSLHLRRLSMLSESSFVSGFGESKERITPSIAHRSPPAASPTRDDGMSLTRNLSAQEGRIRSWIANKDHPASPSKRSVTSLRPETFSSIGEILVPHQPNTRDVRAPVSPTPSKKHRQQVPPQQPSRADYKPSFAGPIFGPDVLPPTPGTMSTATLGGRSSNHSIVAERSLAGTYRQVSGSTAAADDGPYESTFATRSLRGDAAHGVSQVYPNDDTDIEISDDEQHLIAAARDKNDASNYPKDFSGKDNAQRPALTSHVTKSMFNGEDIDAFRPARTISYPSPDRSNQSASQNAPMSNRKASHSTKANGEKTSSAQKGTPYFHNALRRKKAFSDLSA